MKEVASHAVAVKRLYERKYERKFVNISLLDVYFGMGVVFMILLVVFLQTCLFVKCQSTSVLN